MNIFLSKKELEGVHDYADSVRNLRYLNLIDQKNITGSLGEHYVKRLYDKEYPDLELQLLKKSEKGIDAKDKYGETYQIKTITGNTTGSFRSMNFDYLILVIIDGNDYLPNKIFKFKKEEIIDNFSERGYMNSTELRVSTSFLSDFKPIYERKDL